MVRLGRPRLERMQPECPPDCKTLSLPVLGTLELPCVSRRQSTVNVDKYVPALAACSFGEKVRLLLLMYLTIYFELDSRKFEGEYFNQKYRMIYGNLS